MNFERYKTPFGGLEIQAKRLFTSCEHMMRNMGSQVIMPGQENRKPNAVRLPYLSYSVLIII